LTEETSEDGAILGLDTAPLNGLMEEMDRRKHVVFPCQKPHLVCVEREEIQKKFVDWPHLEWKGDWIQK
jgi:hypothetical protein